MDWTDWELIERVPGKMRGRALVKHSRVPADTVVESAELGETPEEIAFNYGLKIEEVIELLAFAVKNDAVLTL